MVKLETSAKCFQVLADPMRLKILCELKKQEKCVAELCDILNVSQPKVSYHLRLMLEAGLIERRTEGTWSYYYLSTNVDEWVKKECSEFITIN